ncbi:galactose-3-O-sulfotransferase 2-like [Mixophyes fleayi]|uniref:galactose-3-O-sulfotransferase 2-like n=1 Tax=Mixophyes fleayi TaxID=3061075 RepID=UPI003F4DF564
MNQEQKSYLSQHERPFATWMGDQEVKVLRKRKSQSLNHHRRMLGHVNRVQILCFGFIIFSLTFTIHFLGIHFAKRSPQTTDLHFVSDVPSSSSSRTCQAKSHIVFLKTHKTAGSTILNLLHRYGDRNDLIFALPFKHQFSYPNHFFSRYVKGFDSPTRPQYDILCHHMRFNLREVRKVMPSDSFFFTIIRDPATMAESAFSYYRSSTGFKKAPNFTAFISNPSHYYQQGEKTNQYAHNLLWFDLGHNPDAPFTEDLARAGVQAVEATFNLVLLAEYFDESMIFLKEELCWELDDVVTFKLNIRGTSKPLEKREVEQLRAWNALDWYLYSYFNRTFWEKIEHFGRVKMDNEVRRLRERRQQLAELCLENLEPVGVEDIRDEAFKPYQSGQAKILGWAAKTNLPPYVRTQCFKMVTPELQYMDLLYARQFPVVTQNESDLTVTPTIQ